MSLRKPEKWELYPLVYPRPRAVVIPYEAVGRVDPTPLRRLKQEELRADLEKAMSREPRLEVRKEIVAVYKDALVQAREEADELIRQSRKGRKGAHEIIKEVCQQHKGITAQDVLGQSRKGPVSRARQHVMYALMATGSYSYPMVGRMLGNRDHTTVLHGVRTHAKRHGLPLPKPSKHATVTGETDDRASSPSAPPPAPDA